MNLPRTNPHDIAGLLDKVIGLGKEVAGHLLNRESWVEAGDAQQNKGTEKLKALREQAKADTHAAKARSYEGKQRAAQRAG
jgi:hypothetical protein